MRRLSLTQARLLRTSRQFLLDTNAFIYFLDGEEPYLSRVLVPLLERVQAGQASVIASVITEAELLVRPERAGDPNAIQRIGDLLSEPGIEVVDVTRRMARRAAALRSRNSLKLPDAIIVATAIETRCEAIIGNDHAWAASPVGVNYILLDDVVRTT